MVPKISMEAVSEASAPVRRSVWFMGLPSEIVRFYPTIFAPGAQPVFPQSALFIPLELW